MAVLVDDGRAAMADAIKRLTIHFAFGTGESHWDSEQTFIGAFDANGIVQLPHAFVSNLDITPVSDPNAAPYALNTDYALEPSTGAISRKADGVIPADGQCLFKYHVNPPPEDKASTALRHEVCRKLVTEKLFVLPDPQGELVTAFGRWKISAAPTNYLYVETQLDFAEASGVPLREYGVFVDGTTNPALPPGQMFFVPADLATPGTLLVIEHAEKTNYRPGSGSVLENFSNVIAL